jgi:AraC-like DNA-binding protein
MVKYGHAHPIEPVGYANPTRPGSLVEVMRLSTLLRRNPVARIERLQRLDFHQVMLFLGGKTEHMVDFERVACARGTFLTVLPGQVQRWAITPGLEAVGLLFKPEFLFPDRPRPGAFWQERFFTDFSWPTAVVLSGRDLSATVDALERLEGTYAEVDDGPAAFALLRHLVSALLLDIARRSHIGATRGAPTAELERVRRFKQDVERSLRVTRRVGDYATRLGCSPKTLDRACREALGVSAKQYITDRVVLEARRLLGHTALPVGRIGEELGFSEPTNFTKFFSAATGQRPHAFRAGEQPRSRRGAPGARHSSVDE